MRGRVGCGASIRLDEKGGEERYKESCVCQKRASFFRKSAHSCGLSINYFDTSPKV
jgi:hypothetical protein